MKKVLSLLAAMMLLFIAASCAPNAQKDECSVLEGQTTVDNCYFEKAIAAADIGFCKKITMSPLRESCISEIGVAMNDVIICHDLDEQPKGNCYAKIAANTMDEKLCEVIESDYWLNICYYNVGTAKNDEKLCDEMDILSERRDDCFEEVAKGKQDEKVCSWIGKENKRYFCYIGLALAKGNASICSRIDNSIWKDGNCIKKVAENLSDSSICEMISISKIRQDCLDKFKD